MTHRLSSAIQILNSEVEPNQTPLLLAAEDQAAQSMEKIVERISEEDECTSFKKNRANKQWLWDLIAISIIIFKYIRIRILLLEHY